MREQLNDGDAAPESTGIAGVPLGGVGAGSMELGRDGRFRNITTNNNRTAKSRIDVSEGAFAAIRAARRGRVHVRILQPDSGIPFAEAGIIPPYTKTEQLNWRGMYPCSHYRLDDKQFPLELGWTALTPIVPYDHEASTLPMVFVAYYVQNPTDAPYDVSLMMNWENLCACTRGNFPERRGPTRPVVLATDKDTLVYRVETEDDQGQDRPKLAGVEFGFQKELRNAAEGNVCLLAKQQQDVEISIMGWNERDPRELQVIWNQFHDEGTLGNKISRSEKSHSGAVCCSFHLPAKKSRNVVFLLAWYFPKYEVEGIDLGNGYANRFSSAIAVATQALTYYRYYFKAVEDWHRRVMNSSLPRWLNKMLINNNYVFSTNSLFFGGNDFTMMTSPEHPLTGALDERFYSSLGTLLFFPNFEDGEITLYRRAAEKNQPGRLYRYLGVECAHKPMQGDGRDYSLDLGAVFVLLVYRNYIMTGRKFIVEHVFPRATSVMEYILGKDVDSDGLPEEEGFPTAHVNWPVRGANCYTSGLWIAAMRAYARMARRLGHKDEASKYEELLPRALDSYDRKFWDNERGYYRFAYDADAANADERTDDACYVGQLAGQWYADFLCLGQLLPAEKVSRALGAICTLNERQYGVAAAVVPEGGQSRIDVDGKSPASFRAWPNLEGVQLACLLIRHGFADRGLFIIQKLYRTMHAQRGRQFNQPLCWDLLTNDAVDQLTDRHMGSTSIWHVLYSLLGFHFNAPDCTLWIRPTLPKGVRQLSVPLFTPICFGWLNFREDDEKGYKQVLQITFDSPVQVKTIVVRVPVEIDQVAVYCESNDGPEDVDHFFGFDGKERVIEIAMKRPVMVNAALKISVRQSGGAKFRFAPTTA